MSRPSILIVEDSPDDFEITQRALRAAGVQEEIVHCWDEEQVIDVLRSWGKPANGRPGLVLLDLNLGACDGHEILETIKADAVLRTVPVVVLTTTADPREIEACYRLGANSFVHKPIDARTFYDSMRSLAGFWLGVASLPSVPG